MLYEQRYAHLNTFYSIGLVCYIHLYYCEEMSAVDNVVMCLASPRHLIIGISCDISREILICQR